MSSLLRKVLALGLLSVLAGCETQQEDAQIRLKLLRGDIDPLTGPSSTPLSALNVRWIIPGNPPKVTEKLEELTEAREFPVRLTPPAGNSEARISLEGLRPAIKRPYSGGRTLTFPVGTALPAETTLFMGPVETFTPAADPVTGPRMGVASAALGPKAALLVGGADAAEGIPVPAEPSMLMYRHDEVRLCGFMDLPDSPRCLSGDEPAPRRDGFAVALSDGTVLHGLGRLATGNPDASIYLTKIDGSTSRLSLSGTLPALYGVAAVVLPSNLVILVGGHNGTQPQPNVYAIDVAQLTVESLAAMSSERAFPGVASLTIRDGVTTTDAILVVGGEGLAGPLASAELYLQKSWQGLDPWTSNRSILKGPRVAPALVRLVDNSVLIWGGGVPGGEVFQVEAGNSVGGLMDVRAPADTTFDAESPALLRLRNGNVLIAGGEPASGRPGQAMIFTPDLDQTMGVGPYKGTYSPLTGSSEKRAWPSLVELGDASVLLAGGGTAGAGATGPNPGATRIEIMVPLPD